MNSIPSGICNVSALLILPRLNGEERICFDYFRFKTITKIPGVFYSYFWQKLALQACVSEPAVLHAVIALGSAHRIDDKSLRSPDHEEIGRPEVFTLQQYSKAINHLRARNMDEHSASLRVMLIACVLFVTLDLLRGEYGNAQTHAESGWKLMSELRLYDASKEKPQHQAAEISNYPSIDECLSESLPCLSIQSALFGCKSATSHLKLDHPIYLSQAQIPFSFRNISEARKSFSFLLNNILSFTEECRSFDFRGITYPPTVQSQQVCLKSAIASWKVAYSRSRVTLSLQASSKGTILGVYLLRIFLTMASIMVETALSRGRQTQFDDYTSHFTSIITQTLHLLKGYSHARTEMGEPLGSASDLAGDFIADIGILPFMYYTALKCRVPWIRRQAIAILLAIPTREGMWDSFIMANVALKVMTMEEDDFFYSFADEIQSTPFDSPVDKNTRLKHIPPLPETSRFYDVELVLYDSSKGKGKLVLRRQKQHKDQGWEEIASVFNFSELKRGIHSGVDYSALFADTSPASSRGDSGVS